MMKRHWVAILLSLTALLLVCNGVQASPTNSGDPALISIDIENGEYSMDSIIFSGIIEEDVEPNEVFWRVSKDGTVFDGGDLSISLEEIVSTSSRPQWSWSFELTFLATGECACYVSVHTIDEDGMEVIETRVVFMVQENTTELIGFLLHEDQSGALVDSMISISGWLGTYPEGEVGVEISGSLTQGLIQSPQTPQDFQCEYLDLDGDQSTTSSELWYSGGNFELDWDISEKLDGWLEVRVLGCSLDQYFDDFGKSHKFSIRVNNQPPVIKISGIDFAIEDDTWHTFDATLTEDPYWGRTDMYYVWTLRRPSHTGSLPIDVQMGDDLNTYSISGTQSGSYTLSLTVYDKGGLSSEQVVKFDIENTIPVASLMIDGESIIDGQEVRLSNPSNTQLDATDSTDTINDAAGLRCIWLLDNVPLYEGCERSFSWVEGDDYRAILTLEVIDDDGGLATLSVELVHPDEVKPFPMALVIFALSALFLTYAMVSRMRGDNEQRIPKWKP